MQKQSLFKQKLKKAKIENQQNENNKQEAIKLMTFPKVFKIQSYQISDQSKKGHIRPNQAQNTTPVMPEKCEEYQTQNQASTFLQNNEQSFLKVIPNNQLNQINQQNWKAINSMTEQQRKDHIDLIESTLPKHFVQKLKKRTTINKVSSQSINEQGRMIAQTTEKQFQKVNKSLTIPTQQQSKTQQQQGQSYKNITNQIHLNIHTGKLSYLPQNLLTTLSQQDKSHQINRTQIYEMLKSENNQSQIIGSQLSLIWLKNIFPTQSLIFNIEKIPYHTLMMLSQMYDVLKVIQLNVRLTQFYSCYLQMLVKSVEIVTIFYKRLSDRQLQQQLLFFQHQLQKSQKTLKEFLNQKIRTENPSEQGRNEQQQKQMLFQSLGIIHQCLKQQKQKRAQQNTNPLQQIRAQENFNKMKNKTILNDLIQAILIQQTLNQHQFQSYQLFPSINKLLQIVNDYWSCKIYQNKVSINQKLCLVNQFYSVIYNLVCRLDRKKREFPFYKNLVKSIYQGLLQIIQQPYLKAMLETLLSQGHKHSQNIHKGHNSTQLKLMIIFKILFIYQKLSTGTQKLAQFLQNQKGRWLLSEQQMSIIIYINFNHYLHVQDLKDDEIQMVQKMLHWIKIQMKHYHDKQQTCRISPQQTLLSLLNLFLSSDQEIYSLIDQSVLNDAIRQTVKTYQSERQKKPQECQKQILSEYQVKSVIQNYNFNSFGNDIFTKVVFWMATSFNSQTQLLIAQQVFMRYPMLFYYASQPIPTQKQANKPFKIQQKSPLLGTLQHYIKPKGDSKRQWFSHESNKQVKANILKLLYFNLSFENINNQIKQIIQHAISKQEIQQSQGFQISKKQINTDNFFYKYLIQPFLKMDKYNQLF